MVEFVNDYIRWTVEPVVYTAHWSNETVDTVLQLTGMELHEMTVNAKAMKLRMENTPFFKKILPSMVNYFETEHYIFVHGWIPTYAEATSMWTPRNKNYSYNPDWRNAGKNDWFTARWQNGMDLAKRFGITEPGKTIVCGHYHCSWGHAKEGRGSEWGEDACFEPYISDGIIALDACTSHSGRVNCIIVED